MVYPPYVVGLTIWDSIYKQGNAEALKSICIIITSGIMGCKM